ncbi:MAG: hypothetical protein JNK25_06180 [Phycisphaerae bacterium]|nr:hypothetical protein [Phycisphaerae bacterium]
MSKRPRRASKAGRFTGLLRAIPAVPKDLVHRTKAVNALELFDRCLGNGVVFEWMTFDAGYGMDRSSCTPHG